MERNEFPLLKYAVFSLLFLISSNVCSQFDAQLSQHMLVPGSYNPGAIGEGDELTVTISGRQQWVSIDNAPSTIFLQAAMPKMIAGHPNGFGIMLIKESIGLFDNQLLQLQYSWKKELFGGILSIGLQGGLLQQNFDADGIYIPTSDYHSSTDASIPTGTLSGLIPDFSTGIWYRRSILYAGISASHLLESRIKLKASDKTTDESNYSTYATRTYYLTGGYNIDLANPLYTLQPSLLLKTDLTALQADISARLIYKDRFWGILGWRPEDAIIVSAGIKLSQGLSIGYSYDISLGALSTASGGSHELYIGFTKKIETASVSKKQKSVRIL